MATEYDTIDGKWWLFEDGRKVRLLSDKESAMVIWGKEEVSCPFCGEGDFDRIGLKSHLLHGDCQQFNESSDTFRI